MAKTSEAGSAGRRSPASGCHFAGAIDTPEIAASTQEIQTARILARFDFSPAVAAVIASHAYTVAETWRRA